MRLAVETNSGFKNSVERGDEARASEKSEPSEASRELEDEGVEESKEDKVEGSSTPGSSSARLSEEHDGESGGVLRHGGILYGSTKLGPNLKAESSLKPGHTQL